MHVPHNPLEIVVQNSIGNDKTLNRPLLEINSKMRHKNNHKHLRQVLPMKIGLMFIMQLS